MWSNMRDESAVTLGRADPALASTPGTRADGSLSAARAFWYSSVLRALPCTVTLAKRWLSGFLPARLASVAPLMKSSALSRCGKASPLTWVHALRDSSRRCDELRNSAQRDRSVMAEQVYRSTSRSSGQFRASAMTDASVSVSRLRSLT